MRGDPCDTTRDGEWQSSGSVFNLGLNDPVVIVGSYNWTEAGPYDNDENTLIVHDRELARAYYAEWQKLWTTVPLERVCSALKVYMPVVLQGYE